jgi:carbonic anhydrase
MRLPQPTKKNALFRMFAMPSLTRPTSFVFARHHRLAALKAALMGAICMCLALSTRAWAVEPAAKAVKEHVQDNLDKGQPSKKNLTLVVNDKPRSATPSNALTGAAPPSPALAPGGSPQISSRMARESYARAKAAVLAGQHDVHWAYSGEAGPSNWANLKPEFATCAKGQRQSPIHIEDHNTLQGPAEPIQINYQPSNATVVNNGHTIQVDVTGNNSITVRGSTYQLVQFHFHHPSEEQINSRRFTMVAHLVHKNTEGQLAVVGVLLSPGAANALIHKVWTYMPLDSGDKVNMPLGMLDLNELLPKDQRYYQFMGSLTTPPCSEQVLWMVLKQPMTLSPEQIRLFAQIFPNNARPVQPLHARLVRSAQ